MKCFWRALSMNDAYDMRFWITTKLIQLSARSEKWYNWSLRTERCLWVSGINFHYAIKVNIYRAEQTKIKVSDVAQKKKRFAKKVFFIDFSSPNKSQTNLHSSASVNWLFASKWGHSYSWTSRAKSLEEISSVCACFG